MMESTKDDKVYNHNFSSWGFDELDNMKSKKKFQMSHLENILVYCKN